MTNTFFGHFLGSQVQFKFLKEITHIFGLKLPPFQTVSYNFHKTYKDYFPMIYSIFILYI